MPNIAQDYWISFGLQRDIQSDWIIRDTDWKNVQIQHDTVELYVTP